MRFRTTGQTTKVETTAGVPALHALVVAPVVGSVVLLLVTAVFAAMAFDAYSGSAGHRSVKRSDRQQPR